MTDSIIGKVKDLNDVSNYPCPFGDRCVDKIPAYKFIDLAISRGLADLAKKMYGKKLPFGQSKAAMLRKHASEIRAARKAGVSYSKIWMMLKEKGLPMSFSHMVRVIRFEIMAEEEGKCDEGNN